MVYSSHVTEEGTDIGSRYKDVTDDDVTVELEEENGKDKGMYIKFADEKENENVDMFVATKEWQVVKKGQAIPRGLHVRYDLQTGVYEAKLLDEEDNNKQTQQDTSSSVSVVPESEEEKQKSKMLQMKKEIEEAMGGLNKEEIHEKLKYWEDGNKKGMMHLNKEGFSMDELKEALKKFKASDDDVQAKEMFDQEVLQKFKSYDELKEDLKKMEMNVKTDAEIIRDLIEEYTALGDITANEEKAVLILEDFEFYVHQIDNALLFADLGGLNLMLNALNKSTSDIQKHSCTVLGSATQSNPKIQIQLMKLDAVPKLLRHLSTEADPRVRSSVLFALSSILRHFPYAQAQFLQHGGMGILKTILTSELENGVKLKVKAATLISDLVTEKKDAETHLNPEDQHEQEKLQQYQMLNLEDFIEEYGICNLLPSLLDLVDHDAREKALSTMSLLSELCTTSFTSENTQEKLRTLKSVYQKLSDEEKDGAQEGTEADRYFTDMLHTIDNMIVDLKITQKVEL